MSQSFQQVVKAVVVLTCSRAIRNAGTAQVHRFGLRRVIRCREIYLISSRVLDQTLHRLADRHSKSRVFGIK